MTTTDKTLAQSAAEAVDYVFDQMLANYGAAWEKSMGKAPIADVKTAWGHSLSDFLHSDDAKRAIVWAVQNLPDFVPNPRQFRSLCKTAPSKNDEVIALPAPNPEVVRRVVEGLRSTPKAQKVDSLEWARLRKARMDAGEKTSPTVRAMVLNALGLLEAA
jgi:hypothetical protein